MRGKWTETLTGSLAALLCLCATAAGEKLAPEWADKLVSEEQVRAALRLKVPVGFENSLGMKFVLIPPGAFMMGSELTAEEVFCEWLSRREKTEYRLPTEAEWEYACRGGQEQQIWPWGDQEKGAQGWANIAGEFEGRARFKFAGVKDGFPHTAPVGSFRANGWGLKDVIGNAFEWCADWSDAGYYAISPMEDPRGPATGTLRIARGGSWNDTPQMARTAFRFTGLPPYVSACVGFRLACTMAPGAPAPQPPPVKAPPPAERSKSKPPQAPPVSYDNAYVTTAATGEKIPHPLTRGPIGTSEPPWWRPKAWFTCPGASSSWASTWADMRSISTPTSSGSMRSQTRSGRRSLKPRATVACPITGKAAASPRARPTTPLCSSPGRRRRSTAHG